MAELVLKAPEAFVSLPSKTLELVLMASEAWLAPYQNTVRLSLHSAETLVHAFVRCSNV